MNLAHEYRSILSTLFYDESKDEKTASVCIWKVMFDLVTGEDLILLLGNALIPDKHIPWQGTDASYHLIQSDSHRLLTIAHLENAAELLLRFASTLYEGSSEVRLVIWDSWFQVMDNLLALGRHENMDVKPSLRIWRDFGRMIQAQEAKMRAEATAQRTAEMGGLVGCGWLRCPLHLCHGAIPDRDMMRCDRCKKVCGTTNTTPLENPLTVFAAFRSNIAEELVRDCKSFNLIQADSPSLVLTQVSQ